jgi:sugar phosphate isomerase/epimerase
VFVAASSECFSDLPLADAIERMSDLEYPAVNIAIHHDSRQITPMQVAEDVDMAIRLCRDTHRLDLAGYSVNIKGSGEEHYRQFDACCRLAKATKVVSITVPSAELGTPFNEEVEHLRELVRIATFEGVLVSILTQNDRLSEDPGTVGVLCDNVKGLGVTLDPSCFICGPSAGRSYESLLKYVYNIQLRDTSKDEFQVRVGQGEVEYSKVVTQLRREGYDRSLVVNMVELDDTDHNSEMRKIRLLLESLL